MGQRNLLSNPEWHASLAALYLIVLLAGATCAPIHAQKETLTLPRYTKGDVRTAQSALSTCPALMTVSSEAGVPGAAMAISANGRFLATWIHTAGGADLTVRNRDTGAHHRIELPAQTVPPGITWRVLGAQFSPDAHWLVVGAMGRVWVMEALTGHLVYSVGVSSDDGLWPGKFTVSNHRLGVAFWPPQSALHDGASVHAALLDIYDLPTGRGLRAFPFGAHTSAAWTSVELSPDDRWLLLLERARTWPGQAHMTLLDVASGQPVWRKGYPVETAGWTADSSSILALGRRLIWLSAKNGQMQRESGSNAGASEFQRLSFNEVASAAIGVFSRYSSFQRLFKRHSEETSLVVLWRMDTAQELCRIPLSAGTAVDGRVTSRAEVVALEETYGPRNPTPRPKAVRIVTYKLAASPPLRPFVSPASPPSLSPPNH
jgi:hypothetical protein